MQTRGDDSLPGCEREKCPRFEVLYEVQTCAIFERGSSRLVLFAQVRHGQRFSPGGQVLLTELTHEMTFPVVGSVLVQK